MHHDSEAGRFTIEPLARHANADAALRAIDAVFFAASGTQGFPSALARARFRERWLGRYFDHPDDAALSFVAVDERGRVAGYVIGSTDDPAVTPRFADIGYFAELGALTAEYPAHLHINLAEDARGRGTGRALIEAFCCAVRARGVRGCHVVTGADARNRRFYGRLGFQPLRTLSWSGSPIVMLGRRPV